MKLIHYGDEASRYITAGVVEKVMWFYSALEKP